ncbi:hypothetical protein RND81_02G146900 [Saponaria officinalis]|uniref:Reverse transcriptase zinc-binding domain-containing protein n=1 Tax=Saponaria officinalis TaxID=3572 RepID=A0AAW1MUM2_SAPOF
MREAQLDSHDGKRKCETLWPIFKIAHQKSRYIYDLYYRRNEISKELYEFCLDQGYADRNLIAKWKKLANKKDHLWVKWVNVVYLRGHTWSRCCPTSSSTWAWRRLCKVEDKMLDGFCGNWWLNEGNDYTVSQGYQWLCPTDEVVPWYPKIWTRMCLPKHSFISWLYMHMRLQTRERMCKFGYAGDICCCLCADSVENIRHLFFVCPYSAICLQLIAGNLKMSIPDTGTWELWDQTRFPSLLHKQVIMAALCALIYQVWKARNHSLHNGVLIRPEIWVKSLIPELVFRCKNMATDRSS